MSPGERRYFAFLGAVAALSLLTIGTTTALERYVGPADQVVPFLVQASAAVADEASAAFRLDDEASERSLAGEMPPPCEALATGDARSHALTPDALAELERECERLD